MTNTPLRIAVAGGGIAGLATAIALGQEQHDVQVHERRLAPESGGGALMLWPNGFAALATLGLAERVKAESAPITRVEFRDSTGQQLSHWDLGALGRGAEVRLVLRAALMSILRAALPARELSLGSSITGFRERDAGVELSFASGSASARTDVLIGCDGIRSGIRDALFGRPPPPSVEHVAWLATVAHTDLAMVPRGVALTQLGHGRRFCVARVDDERVFWYATVNAANARGAATGEALEPFFGWTGAPGALLRAASPQDLKPLAVGDSPLLHRWGRGRVTLLGDAAHASLPDLTQGAGQALESAVALGACFRASTEVEPALRAYERRRRTEVGKVIQTARLVARWSMSEAVHVKTLRDLAARHVLPIMGYPTISRLAGVGA